MNDARIPDHSAWAARGFWNRAYDCALEELATLRAQLAEAQADVDKGAMDYCALMGRHDAEKVRADRAEAALAAQIEVDARLCDALYRMALRDSDNDLSSPWKSHKASAYGTALQAIRAQPHDRTALDRMLAEAREKALREAIEAYPKGIGAILALIEKP